MFFETRCAVCAGRGSVVCERCEAGFRRVAGGCPAQIESCVDAVSVRAVFELEPGIRSVIAALKYRRERRLSQWVATQIAPLVPRGADVITWVPATPARVRQRGFDQAGEIARNLSALTEIPSMQLLERSNDDRRQTEQDHMQRQVGPSLRTIHGPRASRGRAAPGLVVLIDDVVTTGASLRCARSLLVSDGVGRVVAAVLAATRLRRDSTGW